MREHLEALVKVEPVDCPAMIVDVGVHRSNEREPKDWVAPEALFEQYRESVAINAGDAETQRAWMHSNRYPSDELMLELDMVVVSHQPRLMRAGLVDARGAGAVAEILAEYRSWTDVELWRSEEAMTRPEWARVRATAQCALGMIDTVDLTGPTSIT